MKVERDEAQLRITIADTGIGLPADRKRITEPYMTTRTKGTGLGLAIVKKIVEEHFGEMTFADAPGGGTIVRLQFDLDMLERIGSGPAGALEEQGLIG